MTIKKTAALAIASLALNTGMWSVADAASVSVKCEVRSNRSKISVDGAGLNGTYYAIVYSGTGGIRSKLPNIIASSRTGYQVEFDFDSDPADIAAGATKIPYNFIKNRSVYGHVRRASDNLLVLAARATCIAK